MRVHIYVSFHVKVLIPYHFKKIYHAYYDPLLKRLHQAVMYLHVSGIDKQNVVPLSKSGFASEVIDMKRICNQMRAIVNSILHTSRLFLSSYL